MRDVVPRDSLGLSLLIRDRTLPQLPNVAIEVHLLRQEFHFATTNLPIGLSRDGSIEP